MIQDVNAATSSTTVTSATATYGDSSVTLSATVTSSSTVNTGTVTFTVKQGAATIGAATTSGTVTAGAASVAYALPAGLAQGSYTIEASYSGGSGVPASSGYWLAHDQPQDSHRGHPECEQIYGAADPSPLTTANLSVFLAADTITATFSRTAGNTVGPYSITTTLVDPNNRLGNYVVTNAGATFTINTKPVTLTTQNASKTYGEVIRLR